MSLANSIDLRLRLMDCAKERAEQDLKFATAGGKTLGFSPDQLATVRAALVAYAQTGASEALSYLQRHAHLKP